MKGWIGIQLFDKNKNAKALEESRVAFEKATKVNYKFVYGYYGLAMVYVRQNEINKAIKVLEEALKINPGFQQAAEMLNQLKNYSAQQGGM
jgi:tetratricopeptide (TPR) repeat protein